MRKAATRCPACGERVPQRSSYTDRGFRYGNMPGTVRRFDCECGKSTRLKEIDVDLLKDQQEQWDLQRQALLMTILDLRGELSRNNKSPQSVHGQVKRARQKLLEALSVFEEEGGVP